MTLHIPLTAESEARLREYAAAVGKDVTSLVAEAIEEKLSLLDGAREAQRRPRTTEEWLAEFDAWVDSHKPAGNVADDSREGIYEGRGE
ncbi:MAG: hypothetical protein CHACPFDD_03369 [Phycisphaerae bacterium]|nr:hypothetical protein [Phycisphaerae bacterium]